MDTEKINQYSQQFLALLQKKGSLTSQEIREELTELNQTAFSQESVFDIYKQLEKDGKVHSTGFPADFIAYLI